MSFLNNPNDNIIVKAAFVAAAVSIAIVSIYELTLRGYM